MLGVIGYPVFLLGSVLAMFNLINVTHGAGMLALVIGGLFELILPDLALHQGVHFPRIRDFLVSAYRYALRVEAYVGFLTDRYPPFSSRRLSGNRSPENEGT